ncbi:AzlC family ABC transporter permease [Neopoerus faecalis]|uniref:AzlC family ABC transporter permease n=1 Tax=Neopoerus faecalis TaxID=3032125 RepID=UPI0025712F3E|nr:AzlC family ABC transporter permease [Neopoerus faecalis]
MEVEVKPIKQPHHAAALRAAFPATIPVLTGYLCIGMAYGLLMANAGYGVFWALLLSLLCYAGSMEFVAVSLLTAGFDPVQALLMALMINARHAFYGLSMLEKYRGTGWARPFLIFSLTDETFSLVSTLEPPDGVTRRDFYFWISLLDYLYWQVGSVLGALIGGLLPFDTTGLDFALTALFIVLFLEQWRKRENRPAALIGLGCTAVSLAAVGADRLVIPAMVLILAVLLGGRNKLCD